MALSAAQLSPHFLSPLFSSLQASSTSSPDPSARDSYFTENRSNQRPQAPTTASGVLPLPSSKTATYQQHFISRWVTIPAPQKPFFQGSHSPLVLLGFASRLLSVVCADLSSALLVVVPQGSILQSFDFLSFFHKHSLSK